MMAIYMKMGKIEGNVTAQGYEKLIECDSAMLGVARFVNMSVGSGKEREVHAPQPIEVVITKNADKATPYMFGESLAGKAIDEVELKFVKTANDAIETFMTWTLKDVLISSYNASGFGESEGEPMESLMLAYTKVEMKYHPRNPDNTLAAAIPAGYDLRLAKKL
jgi:type VI secretion system secreted protein Hcp